MPSLFEILLDTMPFAAARQAARESCDGKDIGDLDLQEAAGFFELIGEKATVDVELPARNESLSTEEQPLWAFAQGGDDPASVRHVYCRVQDADYVGHRVANLIAWGLEDPVGTFRREIRVTSAAGGQLALPLTPEFVAQRWLVHGGKIIEDQTRLWRLPALLDKGLVAVFAYDIDPSSGRVVPADMTRALDPVLEQKLRGAQDAARELLGQFERDGDVSPDQGQGGAPETSAGGHWGYRVVEGNIWDRRREGATGDQQGGRGGAVSGEVGDVCQVPTAPGTILVIVTFTFCQERADFEPGALVGFARCHPHLFVQANIPLARIEASLHVDRPKHLDRWDEQGRDMKASCCKPPHDGWSTELKSLLVTDTNIDGAPAPLPFWSNFFDYVIVDPFADHAWRPFHVVRTDRPEERTSEEPLVHREIVGGPVEERVKKMPRQGEFDNVHIAPRLRLIGLEEIRDPQSNTTYSAFSPRDLGIDTIVMAPFCAHDCLHMHWRWSCFNDKKWNLGWGPNGPYEVPGAPMVPPNQDVRLWFRSDSAVTYHVVVAEPAGATLAEYEWNVLMHHGFGYAVSIASKWKGYLAMNAVGTLGTSYEMLDRERNSITVNNSTAMLYWLVRYRVLIAGAKPVALSRLTVHEPELRKAREL